MWSRQNNCKGDAKLLEKHTPRQTGYQRATVTMEGKVEGTCFCWDQPWFLRSVLYLLLKLNEGKKRMLNEPKLDVEGEGNSLRGQTWN